MAFTPAYHPHQKPAPRVPPIRTKGPTAVRRASRAHRTARAGHFIKVAVKRADGDRCRWPNCEVPPESFWGLLEVAHVHAAGMGGDPQLKRGTPENLVTLCRWRHQGPFGLHAGRAKVVPLSEKGTRGLCEFWYQQQNGQWASAGVSSPQGKNGDT